MSDTSFFANLDDAQATPLHWAALHGNLDEARALLDADPRIVKAVDSHGWTALHWAAAAGRAKCIALLVRAGASLEARGDESHTPWMAKVRLPAAAGRAVGLALGLVNSRDSKATKGATPLHIAAAMGHVDCICQLIELQACPEAANSLGFTALHLAAACNQLEALRELVRGGADAAAERGSRMSPTCIAAACGSLECLRELILLVPCILAKKNDGWTPLHCAAAAGAADSVRELLATGANVEGGSLKGIRPLHLAAECGHTEAAMVLIRAGADMGAQDICGTPLHFAASRGHIETALALVAAGADMEAEGSLGISTPLLQAAASGKVDVVTALAAAGADINAQDRRGCTCLHRLLAWVAKSKAEDAVSRLQWLLDAGASVELACSHKPTPVDVLLADRGHSANFHLPACAPDIVRMIAAAGCPVRAPLTSLNGTLRPGTVEWWLSELLPFDWEAQWPATLSSSVVEVGVALLQCAATEVDVEGGTKEAVGLVRLAAAAGSIQLVVAALGLLPAGSLDCKVMVVPLVAFLAAMKELPTPGRGGWGERHRQVVHHYCDMAGALLAAGCAPLKLSNTGREIPLEVVELPGWAAPHLRELVQVVASGQRWSPNEAHHAFPPAFRAATRALLLTNHRGLTTHTPGSGDTAEPGQKIGGPPGESGAREVAAVTSGGTCW
ncbi:hypothetical protein N2152v2_008691 [Parachlorella kessleri]